MTRLKCLMSSLVLLVACSAWAVTGSHIPWQPWSDKQFAQAQKEKKFIILDLEAVWCHWCHVMDEETYHDPKVVALIKAHYIPVRVDQDSRPDLSRRYEDFGWPATIVFNAQGEEIVKRRGYIAPERMAKLLAAIVNDPSPVKYANSEEPQSYSERSSLDEKTRADLIKRFIESHDGVQGGLKHTQKFLDANTVEYALALAKNGDRNAAKMARQTLQGTLNIFDPAWGGVYQYSTHSDWKHPHFEKIMSVQTESLRIYALAYQILGEKAYLKAASEVLRYLDEFLTSPDGAYYTSQDADLIKGKHSEDYFALGDNERRAKGIPQVDKHIYARENGWVIQALAQLYGATNDARILAPALKAAQWIQKHRALPDGGFRHDAKDPAGPYLEDSLSMGRAYLSLYTVTGERTWLAQAESAMKFMRAHFSGKGSAGFISAIEKGPLKPLIQLDENIALARFANLLARYTGNQAYTADARKAMRFIATPAIATRRISEPGILLADIELHNDPVHITVVGRKDDPNAKALFIAATRFGANYRRIEWWDTREAALPNADVTYPSFDKAAAFVCTNQTCSLPVFKEADLQTLATRITRFSANARVKAPG